MTKNEKERIREQLRAGGWDNGKIEDFIDYAEHGQNAKLVKEIQLHIGKELDEHRKVDLGSLVVLQALLKMEADSNQE